MGYCKYNWNRRNLGASVSFNTKAIQELYEEIQELKTEIEVLENV